MDHTFNEEQLESHIFDVSDSMGLSKQYFTTLQLLRIARQRIENHRVAWEQLREVPDTKLELYPVREYASAHRRGLSKLDNFVLLEGGDEIFKAWEEQRGRVTQLFKTRAKSLVERIDQKTKEVESLRDGVCAPKVLLLQSGPLCPRSTTLFVFDTDWIALQRDLAPGSDERNGPEPRDLLVHRCHNYICPSKLPYCKQITPQNTPDFTHTPTIDRLLISLGSVGPAHPEHESGRHQCSSVIKRLISHFHHHPIPDLSHMWILCLVSNFDKYLEDFCRIRETLAREASSRPGRSCYLG